MEHNIRHHRGHASSPQNVQVNTTTSNGSSSRTDTDPQNSSDATKWTKAQSSRKIHECLNNTRAIHMVDALGNLFRFLLLPRQAHDMKGGALLIYDVSFGALLADKAFDADWLLKRP